MALEFKVKDGKIFSLVENEIDIENCKRRKNIALKNIIIEQSIIDECDAILSEASKLGLKID